MKFHLNINNKEKILSYGISFVITIIAIVFSVFVLNKIHFFQQVSKVYLILIIFIVEFLLFLIVVQKVVFQYFQYKKKIFGEMFKYKIIIYVFLNLGIIFLIFSSFIIYFNFNKQKRLNYYKINKSLEITYSTITNLISQDKEKFVNFSKEITMEIKNFFKLNNKNAINTSNIKNNNFYIFKDIINKKSSSINKKLDKNKIVLIFLLKQKNSNLTKNYLYLNSGISSYLEDIIKLAGEVNIFDKAFIKKLNEKYFIFVKIKYNDNNYLLYGYFPDQEIYKLNEKIYPGYKTFKTEFSIFKYTPILYLLSFVFLFIPLLFLQIFLTIDFINKLNKPLKILLTGFEKINKIEINEFDSYKINDEFYFLLNKFYVMQKELTKNQIYKRYKDRYEIYKMVTSKFAHEIKNPLTPITLSAQLIKKKYPYLDDFKEYLEKKINIILDNSKMIKNIIEKIYNFSNEKKEENSKFNFIEFLKTIKTTWNSEKVVIDIENKVNDDITIQASITDFYSIFNNLIINSINATSGICQIKIIISYIKNNNKKSSKNEDNFDKEGKLIIDYYDNGPGIAKEIHKFIFEPFFTTNVNGSGLGLAIIKSTLKKYNGKILYIDDTKGAHFRININYNIQNL